MKKVVIALLAIVSFPLSANASLGYWIDYSTKYMQRAWIADPVLKELRLPHVVSLNEGSHVFGGGCSGAGHVTGSHWCSASWTIMHY